MRISSSFLYQSTNNQISKALESLYDASTKASSGKKFSTPSDDPVAAMNTIRLNQSLREVEKYMSIQEDVKPYLTMAESSLTSMNETVRNIKTDLGNAGNSSTTEDQMKTISANIGFAIDGIVNLANTQYNNVYIFSGQRIDTIPFVREGDKIKYEGSLNTMSTEASPGINVEASTPGSELFTVHTIVSEKVFADINTPLAETSTLTGSDIITIQSGDETATNVTINYDTDSIEDIVSKINLTTDANATLTKVESGYSFSINSKYIGSQGTLKLSDQAENGFFKHFNMSNATLGVNTIEDPEVMLTGATSLGLATGTYTFDIVTQASGTVSFSFDSATSSLSEIIEEINSTQESVTATLEPKGNNFTIGLQSSVKNSDGEDISYEPFTIRDSSSPGIVNGIFGKDLYTTQDITYGSKRELTSATTTFGSQGFVGGPHSFDVITDNGTTTINVDYATDSLTDVVADINAITDVTANVQIKNGLFTLDISGVDNESILIEESGAGFLNDLEFSMNQTTSISENDYRTNSLLDQLVIVKNQLQEGNNSNISGASESILDSMENILNIEFSIAYQTKRIETAKSLGQEQKLTLEEMIADAEQIDLTEAVNNLTMAQTAYQASLVSSTKVLGLSLLDYI